MPPCRVPSAEWRGQGSAQTGNVRKADLAKLPEVASKAEDEANVGIILWR